MNCGLCRVHKFGFGWCYVAGLSKWWRGCGLERSAQAGDRNADTCHMLWSKVPKEYKGAFGYSDLLEAYQKIVDEKQHKACQKKEGQTNHHPKATREI